MQISAVEILLRTEMLKISSACIFLLSITGIAHAGGGIKNVHSTYLNGQTVEVEPPPGHMNLGDVLYVNDGSCPAGQVKQVTAPMARGERRTKQCVVH